MKKIVLSLITLVMVVSLSLVACAKPAPAPAPTEPAPSPAPVLEKEQELRAEDYARGWGIHQDSAELMFEEITRETGGKITFNYMQGTIGTVQDAPSNAGKRVLDLAWGQSSYSVADNVYWETIGLPVPNRDPWAVSKAVAELMVNDPVSGELATRNVVSLKMGVPVTLGGLVVNRPINSLDDLKGLKIRGPSVGLNLMFEELGAISVPIPGPEVYDALDKGVIDGAFTSLATVLRAKWYETAESLIVFNIAGAAPTVWLINKDLWNGFIPATRDAFNAAGDSYIDEFVQRSMVADEKLVVEFETEYGLQVYIPSGADLDKLEAAAKKAQQVYFDEWSSKGYDTEKFFNRYIETISKYEKEVAQKGYPWER